jgi:hypothetical protein
MDISAKKERPNSLTNMPSLLYLNADMGSVFESQVGHLLNSLSETKQFSRLILLCGVKDKNEEARVQNSFQKSGVEVAFFKHYPNFPFYNRLQQREIGKALLNLNLDSNCIIHIRGELLASQALNPIVQARQELEKVIVDVRGAGLEELTLYFNGAFWKKVLKKINYKIALSRLKKFSRITAVSESLKEYLVNSWAIKKEKISVVHCLAGKEFTFDEAKRKKTRESLGISEDTKLLVFSTGGNAGWQNTNTLKAVISEKWTILNLSKEQIHEPHVISKYIPYEEVPAYLNAADAAVIFRDKTSVNKVACPVKFCEYVCCGLPVISDEGVDLIMDYIKSNQADGIIKKPAEIHQLNLDVLIGPDRASRAAKAQLKFGYQTIVQQYLNVYFSNS